MALLAITAALGEPAAAAELAQPAGLVREAVAIPFRQSDGSSLKLDAVVIRGATFFDLWEPVAALLVISAVLIAASARAFQKTVT